MRYAIGLISPYDSLTDQAKEIAEAKGILLEVRKGVLGQATLQARELESEGFDVVIARDITAAYVRDKINIPIVPISITTADLLTAILRAKRIAKRVLLANFRRRYSDTSLLRKTLNMPIDEFTFDDEADGRRELQRRIGDYDVLVGGGYVARLAKEYGMIPVMIESSRESIQQAFEVACSVAECRWEERRRSRELATLIDRYAEGIIAVNGHYEITIFNRIAARAFGISGKQTTVQEKEWILSTTCLASVIEGKEAVYERLVKIGNKDYVVTTVPVLMDDKVCGGMCTLRDVEVIQKIERNTRMNLCANGLTAKVTLDNIVGQSEAIKETISRARKFARTDFTVLITGETGTGKELFAQGIHNFSNRSEGPFVGINCAAIAESLLEAELFGYEGGAFTGAKKEGKIGLFELGHGGTVFLDEIGDLPLTLQARLLRALQEREIIRVGGSRVIPIDVRIIAATNSDLAYKTTQGEFREDLYHRLNVLRLHVRPLRERRSDIPLIARHILKERYHAKPQAIDAIVEAITVLEGYEWKGNVREVENILANLVVLFEDISLDDAALELKRLLGGLCRLAESEDLEEGESIAELSEDIRQARVDAEILAIKRAKGQGLRKTQIAENLGIGRTTLWRKMKKYNL